MVSPTIRPDGDLNLGTIWDLSNDAWKAYFVNSGVMENERRILTIAIDYFCSQCLSRITPDESRITHCATIKKKDKIVYNYISNETSLIFLWCRVVLSSHRRAVHSFHTFLLHSFCCKVRVVNVFPSNTNSFFLYMQFVLHFNWSFVH